MSTRTEVSIQPAVRTIDGIAIRYAESRRGTAAAEALLLSPWPESLFAFEPTWARLAGHARLVAVDLPGFGHSERRDALMSPRAMGEFVVRLADAFGLEQPHVVGPDIGTGASLFAAARNPGRFRSLVVGSGGAAFPLQLDGVLREWVEATELEPYRAMGGRAIITAVMETLERYDFPEHVREDYLDAYAGDRFVESMRYVRAYPSDLRVLGELLPTIDAPVLVIAGRHDPVVPLANAEYLHARVPRSKLAVIEAGHFTWEDAADEYAALVTGWWSGGHVAAATARRD